MSKPTTPDPRNHVLAASLPKVTLTPEQQMEAVKRVQSQAEERVQIGVRLFQAADAHINSHRSALEELKQEQATLRDEIHRDVAKTLQGYDQWMGSLEENYRHVFGNVETRLDAVDQRLAKLETKVLDSQEQMLQMLDRCQALLDRHTAAPPKLSRFRPDSRNSDQPT